MNQQIFTITQTQPQPNNNNNNNDHTTLSSMFPSKNIITSNTKNAMKSRCMANQQKNKQLSPEEKCNKFHQMLFPGFMRNTKQNLRIRVDAILFTIRGVSPSVASFQIARNFVNAAMEEISPSVHKATHLHLRRCKSIPKTLDEYKIQSRNGLSRNKSQFLADHVFVPIIFQQFYNFCLSTLDDEVDGICVFVDALTALLKSNVPFPQSKPLPLIPYTVFVRRNKFKNIVLRLLSYYQIQYQTPKNYATSKVVCDQVILCLQEIKQRCHLKKAVLLKNIPENDTFTCHDHFGNSNFFVPIKKSKKNNKNVQSTTLNTLCDRSSGNTVNNNINNNNNCSNTGQRSSHAAHMKNPFDQNKALIANMTLPSLPLVLPPALPPIVSLNTRTVGCNNNYAHSNDNVISVNDVKRDLLLYFEEETNKLLREQERLEQTKTAVLQLLNTYQNPNHPFDVCNNENNKQIDTIHTNNAPPFLGDPSLFKF